MWTLEEALDRLLADVRILGTERVPVGDADGRWLAEDVVAEHPEPRFDLSAMDGYALCISDLSLLGELRVVGESRAGHLPSRLEPKTAMRIFTGAVVPAGANCVVMQEDVVRNDATIRVRGEHREGEHIRRRGSDFEAGTCVLRKGVRLGPAALALLASIDRTTVVVARKPRVAILPTGDEVRAPGEPDAPARIADSNSPMLVALATSAGAEPIALQPVRDDIDAIRCSVAEALQLCDVLVTVGGVSVGDHDVVKQALERAGVKLALWKVAIKPGKPLAFGHNDRHQFVLGLPGNPVSAYVTFALFGMPLLRALSGARLPLAPRSYARLATSVRRKPGRTEFLRATLVETAEGPLAHPAAHQGSASLIGLAEANALVVVPAEVSELAAGDRVEVLRVQDL